MSDLLFSFDISGTFGAMDDDAGVALYLDRHIELGK